MANKYIRHGETFCGDGTTSAAATSNGGVGAWNNINVLEGTAPAFGALVAGDKVYIRSKDAAGANIGRSFGAAVTIGVTAATELSPIVWVVDRGIVWSGVEGTVTYTITTQSLVTLRDFNHVIADSYNLVFVASLASASYWTFFTFGKCTTKDIKIDLSAQTLGTSSYGAKLVFSSGTHHAMWVRQAIRLEQLFLSSGSGQAITFISPKIELLEATNKQPIFSGNQNFDGNFTIFGGEIFGVGASDGVPIFTATTNCGPIEMYGLKFPRAMVLSTAALMTKPIRIIANGCDGILGNAYHDYNCAYDSRDDGYYPTLNGMLETSDSGAWSYKLYPFRTTYQSPALINISKLYTAASAAKTITADILWPTSLADPTTDKVFFTAQYTDNTSGLKVTKSSLDMTGGVLTTSTAGWSANTYGPTLFNKFKMQITTAGEIRQDTEVVISITVIPRSVSVNDIMFIDPDPSFS